MMQYFVGNFNENVFKVVKIDRTYSGNIVLIKKFPDIDSAFIPRGVDDLKFRILLDKNIVEVFINDDEHVITDLIFLRKRNGAVQFFATDPRRNSISQCKSLANECACEMMQLSTLHLVMISKEKKENSVIILII